jgi:hypothetical protein
MEILTHWGIRTHLTEALTPAAKRDEDCLTVPPRDRYSRYRLPATARDLWMGCFNRDSANWLSWNPLKSHSTSYWQYMPL